MSFSIKEYEDRVVEVAKAAGHDVVPGPILEGSKYDNASTLNWIELIVADRQATTDPDNARTGLVQFAIVVMDKSRDVARERASALCNVMTAAGLSCQLTRQETISDNHAYPMVVTFDPASES